MPDPKPLTAPAIRARKRQTPLTMVTAYDYPSAVLAAEAGIEILLVGDSLGMVVQGESTPLPVTLAQMRYHTRLVTRGAPGAFVIADLPFLSYQLGPAQALKNAGGLLKTTGAQAVKLEGGAAVFPQIAACTTAGIPVMGHVGLTPQSVHQLGGYKVQRGTDRLLADALAVEAAGAFAVVIECVPSDVAAEITERLTIPTIGIGAGNAVDGQVLVWHDLLGLTRGHRPKFVKAYSQLADAIVGSLKAYRTEVESRQFPGAEHEFH